MPPALSRLIRATLQRKSLRVKLHLPIEITAAPRLKESTAKQAILSDLSVTGGFIAVDCPLGEPGEFIALDFTLPLRVAPEAHLKLSATIQSVRRLDADQPLPTFAHGVKFHEVSPGDRERLQKFVYTAIPPE